MTMIYAYYMLCPAMMTMMIDDEDADAWDDNYVD